MLKFNVSVPKKYVKDGVEKKFWNNVGKITMFEANGDKELGLKLELFMFPDTPLYVFADKPKNDSQGSYTPKTTNTSSDPISDGLSGNSDQPEVIENSTEEINPEDIPF